MVWEASTSLGVGGGWSRWETFDPPWETFDPSRWPFSAETVRDVVADLIVAIRADGGRVAHRVDEALVGRLGPWITGWEVASLAGDHHGCKVCLGESLSGEDVDAVIDTVVEGVVRWRVSLEAFARLFELHPFFRDVDTRGRGTRAIVAAVLDLTGGSDTWYLECSRVLRWWLQRWGVEYAVAYQFVGIAVGGSFGSWMAPDEDPMAGVEDRFSRGLV